MIGSLKDQELNRLYKKIPNLKCKGLCSDSCGPIKASKREVERLEEVAGKKLKVNWTLTCSILTKEGKCSAYEVRPLICRLWGVVKKMKCPHGCEPEVWLSDRDAFHLMFKAIRIGGEP